MAFEPDIAAVAPVMELTISYLDRSLRCTGTLDGRTRCHLVEAVDELLASEPPFVVIDVGELHVADVDGANALALVQRKVRAAGGRLRWHGLDSDRLRGILPLRSLSRPPRKGTGGPGSVVPFNRALHPSTMPPSA